MPAEQVSVNQWRLARPGAGADHPLRRSPRPGTARCDHPIYMMCGTSIEADHVLINPHAVHRLSRGAAGRAGAAPARLSRAPGRWARRSTAGPDGVYVADSYDQLVDSPILLGRLTRGPAGRDRRAGRRLRLFRDRPDHGDPAARRHERHAATPPAGSSASCRWTATPSSTTSATSRRGRVGALVQLGVRAAGGRRTPTRWASG